MPLPPTVPTFSVVVPTLFRPAQLARCLQALAELDYRSDAYEIVIVDDGASAETEAQVAAAERASGVATRYLARSRGGPARARNAGAAVARGRYLAFTDDDCVPAPGWLAHLSRGLDSDDSGIVGGQTFNGLPDVLCSTASQLLIDFLYEYFHVEQSGARFFTTNNLAVTADRFAAAGGFDELFPLAAGEDREFCERWQRSGGHLVYASGAIVHHIHDLNFRRYLRQHFNYGRGAEFLHQSRARHAVPPARPRRRYEPPSFYARLVMYPFSRKQGLRAWPLSALMATSQLAYVVGYLYQRLRRL